MKRTCVKARCYCLRRKDAPTGHDSLHATRPMHRLASDAMITSHDSLSDDHVAQPSYHPNRAGRRSPDAQKRHTESRQRRRQTCTASHGSPRRARESLRLQVTRAIVRRAIHAKQDPYCSTTTSQPATLRALAARAYSGARTTCRHFMPKGEGPSEACCAAEPANGTARARARHVLLCVARR